MSSNDLLEREKAADRGKEDNPEQEKYDKRFAELTDPAHYKKEGSAPHDQIGKGYTGEGSSAPGKKKGRIAKLGAAFGRLSGRRKLAIFAAGGAGVAGLAGGIIGMLGVLNVFQLDHLLNNIEAKAFVRYQVDMDGRSNRWIAAYLALRLGEVESSLKPADRDNILFRANTIEANSPVLAWYKLMRGTRQTAKFEQDLLEKQGIKFASIACRGTISGNNCIPGGNIVRFRPAVITIRDEQIPFKLTAAEIRAIENGDVNGFNNNLRQFIDTEIINNDKAARKKLKEAVKSNTKSYQVIKRYFLRKSIQNMTGIRDWRLFENTKTPRALAGGKRMTPDEYREFKRGITNRVIAKTFPESMVGGKFIQCLFGLTSCRGSTDPNDPEVRSPLAPPDTDCTGTPKPPNCQTNAKDADGNGADRDQSGTDGLKEGISPDADGAGSVTKKVMLKVLSKLSGPVGLLGLIDQLYIVHTNIQNGAISKGVYMARATQAIGMFTTFGIMRDQIRTGEVNAQEVDAAMDMINNAGNSEGWQDVVAAGDSSIASAAASIETTNSRNEYCSAEFQERMLLPENKEVASKQYHWRCDSEKIGGDNLAKDIENGWNNSIGIILNPIMAVYEASGLSTVMGWFNSALEAIFSATIAPIMKAILDATGLSNKIEDLVAWLGTKVMAILGAGPSLSEDSPGGVLANHAVMGASASSEFAARNQGAAATTPATARDARKRVATYQEETRSSMGMFEKYLSLDNPKSAAAQGLFAITNGGARQTFMATLSSLFSGSIFAPRVGAATDPAYAAANWSGVQTYDFPSSCTGQPSAALLKMDIASLDANDPRRNYFPLFMTPLSATNADDLGYIPAEEITWELLGSHEQFNERLFKDDISDDDSKKVWNCRLLDSSVSGGLGATTSSKMLDENAYGYGFNSGGLTTPGGVGSLPTGTAQELAQRIIDHPNISFQVTPRQEDAMKLIARTGKGSTCGSPAVSPLLLGVILAAAEKYKLVIGVLVDGHSCNSGFHPKGMAVDFNGVSRITGSTGNIGNRIPGKNGNTAFDLTDAQTTLLKEFYTDLGSLLEKAGGGGLGQIGCFSGTKPAPAPKVSYFPDTCHHIHMDVGKR